MSLGCLVINGRLLESRGLRAGPHVRQRGDGVVSSLGALHGHGGLLHAGRSRDQFLLFRARFHPLIASQGGLVICPIHGNFLRAGTGQQLLVLGQGALVLGPGDGQFLLPRAGLGLVQQGLVEGQAILRLLHVHLQIGGVQFGQHVSRLDLRAYLDFHHMHRPADTKAEIDLLRWQDGAQRGQTPGLYHPRPGGNVGCRRGRRGSGRRRVFTGSREQYDQRQGNELRSSG